MAASAGMLALADSLFAAPKDTKTPSPDLEKLADNALRESKKYKATYCDIRIVRLRDQRVGLRLSPERGTGKTTLANWMRGEAARGSWTHSGG